MAPAEVDGAGSPRKVADALLAWFRRVRRPLPWRRDRDPYRIWVAEVLLQQTRVAQATPYFERFVDRFPTVEALAQARLPEVLTAWAGAGYYGRARRLHEAARTVVDRCAGQWPSTVEGWEALPGVGPYIARAVVSLAFGLPVVALEANGARVVARWRREEGDITSNRVRSRLGAALALYLPGDAAGAFNEAVMELGETVCTPVSPNCPSCPVRFGCRAYRELADPATIPKRAARKARPHLRAAVAVVADPSGRWLVQRRPLRGLLGGLWEFPGGKIRPGERPAHAARRELFEETGLRAGRLRPAGIVRHGYSHFSVTIHVFEGVAGGTPRGPRTERRWVRPDRLGALPLPRATEKIVARLSRPGTASPDSGSRPGRTSASPTRARRRRPRRARARRTGVSAARSRAPH